MVAAADAVEHGDDARIDAARAEVGHAGRVELHVRVVEQRGRGAGHALHGRVRRLHAEAPVAGELVKGEALHRGGHERAREAGLGLPDLERLERGGGGVLPHAGAELGIGEHALDHASRRFV